ncbi:Os08g0161950 [Oryza sativa Japonica Group]|uniref:Os08g0161950 protein n=1 Tax=Oryza sativa subsp. japonica TaxID=39947 RepID=A0A0P0XC13_ORYSJ|nr:hypothetical protein EE612_042262 [Oryza sativa]BAT03943.1 Os08g0161950 [Oryza sativa Japonica Group]
MSNLILRLPLLPFSLTIGIPSFAIASSYPGVTTSVSLITRSRPSRVFRLTVVPANASTNSIFWCTRRSLPSLVYRSWGFSSITNTRSAGSWFGCSFPLSGNVILVPFFHPGFISIVRISDSVPIWLRPDNVPGYLHLSRRTSI